MEEEGTFLNISECTAILENWQSFVKDESPTSLVSLEKVCGEIKDLKSSAIARRKNLNDITKAFRVKTKEEQVLMMADILKPYQDEIDLLSKRAKHSEGAFMNLFKSLNDTPNPCVAIESLLHLVTTSSVHSIEIQRLKGELSQYEEEFQQLKNQDITIRRLEDQLAEFKEKIEDKVAEEVNVRVTEVEAQAENRINEVKEVQRNVEKRLAAALESMKQAQQSADRAQTQLYEMSTQVEKRVSSLQSENSILAEGSSRQAIRIAELEAECGSLKRASEQMNNMSQHSLHSASADGNDAMTLHLMVNDLREELRRQEDLLRSEKQRLEGLLRDVTQQLNKEKEASNKVRVELAERPTREDYISIRRQLKSLQRIAFNVQDDESEKDSQWDPENTNADKNQLEALLSMRMKSLETELTDTRRELNESRQSENAAKELVGTLKKSLENSTNLIIRLEADLEGKSAAFENKQKVTKNGSMELAELLGVSDTINEKKTSNTTATTTAGDSGANNATHMVNILQTQRDRYKEKLTLAEGNLLKLQQKVESAETAKAQLEADNLALYSKIRFLQSYTAGGSNNYGGGAVKNYISPKPMKIAVRKPAGMAPKRLQFGSIEEGRSHDDDDDFDDQMSNIEGKYHQLYEQRMNPFAEFSHHEKQRKLQELTVADRIVLNTTMAIVSNQMGRSFLLGYLGSLHILVFFILYYMTHHVHGGCDPQLDNQHHHQQQMAAAGVVLSKKL